jgi:hypothetical protein
MRIFITLLILFPVLVSAQKVPFALTNNIWLERFFVGFLSETLTSVDEPAFVKNSTELRVALMLRDSVNKKSSFRIFGALTLSNQSYTNSSAEFIWKPDRKTKIVMGYTATLTTELRPNPTTAESLIESKAQATIPGARPTIKLQYKYSNGLSLGVGLSYHDSTGAIHAGINIKNIRLAGFVSKYEYLIGSDGQFRFLNYTITYRKSGVVSVAVFSKFKKSISPFIDLQFPNSHHTAKVFGIRKYFAEKSNLAKGFMASCFNLSTKTFFIQFYLHI